MSVSAVRWALEKPIKASEGKFVLVALAEHFNEETTKCCPSQELLAFETGTSKRTIINHLAKLESLGLISRQVRSREDGSRRSDSYTLHFAWQPETCSHTVNQGEDISPYNQGANFSGGSENNTNQGADFSGGGENNADQGANFANQGEILSPLEPEVNQNESELEPEERTRRESSFQAFEDLWHEHKAPLWVEIQVLGKRRQTLLSKLITDTGSFELALDIFSSAIQEAALTEWFKSKKLSLENIMSNDKLIGLAERFKQRQDLPDEDDISTWTEEDYLKNWGTIPENITWGTRA